MKKISAMLFIGLSVLGTSCKKYLDINKDPNFATIDAVSPQSLLPQALTATANNLNGFNTMGAQIGGYMANAGGYGGFGVNFTYNYTSSNFSNLWNGTFDNLLDYQTIINRTEGKPELRYYNAAAKIMKVHGFQMLVDAYNDVPYFEALLGEGSLTPKYDSAKLIYKDLGLQLDKAIAIIDSGASTIGEVGLGATDVLFQGDMISWKKLANTIKLKLAVQAVGRADISPGFSADGFLTQDALINPGYLRDGGRQNPKWTNWAYNANGTPGNKAWMPSKWIMSFYNSKLVDTGRGKAIYKDFKSGTPTNQLGYEQTSVVSSPDGGFWYPRTVRIGLSSGDTTGVLKGPKAGMPLMTAAESYFLQAEAIVRSILSTGTAKERFEKGVTSSFKYLSLKEDNTYSENPDTLAKRYFIHPTNSGNYWVNFDLATDMQKQIEAIITQKYIALNMVNSDAAWNDYRRTGYPKVSGTSATTTFASLKSESSRADHLPTRILYPASEGAYNPTNVPKNINPFTSTIFWAN